MKAWNVRLPRKPRRSIEDVERRKAELVARKLAYHLEHTTAGGTPPLTFWQKVQVLGMFAVLFGLILLMAWFSSGPHQ